MKKSNKTFVVSSVSKQHYAAYQVHTKCHDEQVLWITNAKVEKVTRFLFGFEMYATNPRMCNNLSQQDQAKLQKIKELTSILKVD